MVQCCTTMLSKMGLGHSYPAICANKSSLLSKQQSTIFNIYKPKIKIKMDNQNQSKVISVNTETGETKKTELQIPSTFNWEALEKAETQPNVAPVYLEFENPGTKIRGFYLGTSHIEKTEDDSVKKIPVILILTKEGAVMNGGVSLYDNVSKFCRIGEAIEIEYLGKEKVTNGHMKKYAVRPLTITE